MHFSVTQSQSKQSPAIEMTTFDEQVRFATQRVRVALGDAFGLAGVDASKPTNVSRSLGLDKSLAWKACRMVTDEDASSVVSRLPGRAGVRILIEAFERARVEAVAVTELREAFKLLDEVITTHAGSRDTLQAMIGGATADVQRERDEAQRKLAFQGQSATWGVRTRVQLASHFVFPSKTPGKLDLGVMCGLIDFRRLRADVPWAMANLFAYADDGAPIPTRYESLDETLAPGEAPLMKSLCSPSLPPLRGVPGRRDGMTRFELTEGPVGNMGSATCIMGWCNRGTVEPRRTENEQYGEAMTRLNTPAEVAIHDLFVHRSLKFAMKPTVHVYSQLPGGPVYPYDGRDQGLLPIADEIIDLGEGPPDLTTPELPRYRSMIELAASKMGVVVGELHGFRLRLRYPPVPSLALFRYELPE